MNEGEQLVSLRLERDTVAEHVPPDRMNVVAALFCVVNQIKKVGPWTR